MFKKLAIITTMLLITIILIGCQSNSSKNTLADYNPLFADGHLAVRNDGGLVGLLNESGEYDITPQYSYMIPLEPDLYFVVDKNNKSYVINSANERVDNDDYGFYNGYYVFQDPVTDLVGLKDYNDNVVIPAEYDSLFSPQLHDNVDSFGYFINELTSIRKNKLINAVKDGKAGVINYENKTVFDFTYDSTSILGNGMVALTKDSKTAVGNAKGHVLTGFDYTVVSFSDPRYPHNALNIQFLYSPVNYQYQYVMLYNDGKFGFFDMLNGKVISEPVYKYIYLPLLNESGHTYAITDDDYLVYINGDGSLITPKVFHLGNENNLNFIETNPEVQNKLLYKDMILMANDSDDPTDFFIYNLAGKKLYDTTEYQICDYTDNYIVVMNSDNEYGIVDFEGNIKYDFGVKQPWLFGDGLFVVSTDAGNNLYNINGDIVKSGFSVNYIADAGFNKGYLQVYEKDVKGDGYDYYFIDEAGNALGDLKFANMEGIGSYYIKDYVHPFVNQFYADGYAIVKTDGIHIINTDGEIIDNGNIINIFPLYPFDNYGVNQQYDDYY